MAETQLGGTPVQRNGGNGPIEAFIKYHTTIQIQHIMTRLSLFKRTKKIFCAAGETIAVGTMCALAHHCDGANARGSEMPSLLENLEWLAGFSCPQICVLVRLGRSTHTTVVLSEDGYLIDMFLQFKLQFMRDFYITYKGKPLQPTMKVSDLNIHDGDVLHLSFSMKGGASHSLQYEKYLRVGDEVDVECSEWEYPRSKSLIDRALEVKTPRLHKKVRQKCKRDPLHILTLQSDETEVDLRAFLDKHVDRDIVSLVEDLSILCVQLLRAPTAADKVLALVVFVKLRTGTSLLFGVADIISDVVNDVTAFVSQSDETDDTLQRVTDIRSLLANWDALQNSTIAQQVMKVYKYAIAVGALAAVGVKIDDKVAYMCKKDLGGPLAGPNFVIALLDAVALFVQRALLYSKTKQWSTFFHGPTSYGAWYDVCQKLKREFLHVGDLEAHGTSYHQFVSELTAAIESGEAILKFGNTSGMGDAMAVKKLLNEMKLIQADIFTFTEAQKSRRPPFALLVHGKTCVGKSLFTEVLFQWMGRVMNLPRSEEFKYSRNPADPFWSGWNSAKWFIHLDDIAYLSPTSPQQDMSLAEVIQLVNDVVMVPNQARLEDKGKNPVRARAVVATTNTKHLNAHAHFACPIAVQRRLPFVVTVQPKPQYARDDDMEMIDSNKLPAIENDWPDFWIITVERVVAAGENMASYDQVRKFNTIQPFLMWLKETILQYSLVQARAGQGNRNMAQFDVCDKCDLVKPDKCVCAVVDEYNARLWGNTDPTKLNTQAGEFPVGVTRGQPFVLKDVDGISTRIYEYNPCDRVPSGYMLTTTTFQGEKQICRITCPASFTNPTVGTDLQADDVAMADILAELVKNQRDPASGWLDQTLVWSFCNYLEWYSSSRIVRRFTNSAMEWQVVRKIVLFGIRNYSMSSRTATEMCGTIARAICVPRKWKIILGGVAAVSALVTAYGMYTSFQTKRKQKVPEMQGLRASVDASLFPKTEKENVWKRDDFQISSFDLTNKNVAYRSLSYDQVNAKIMKNVARIKVSNGERVREGNAFCIGGHLWVSNSHTVFEEGDVQVTLLTESMVKGVSPNVSFKLRQEDVFRQPGDLVFFEVHCWEVKADLRDLIRKDTLMGRYTGALLGYDKQIVAGVNTVKCIEMGSVTADVVGTLEAWHGYVSKLTVVGDCGMPLIVHEPVTAILGIHTLGNKVGETWCAALSRGTIDKAIAHFNMPIVQCAAPVIDAPSRPKQLTSLRIYSPLRWMDAGSLRCYGSFTDYSVTSRSKVKPTLLGPEIIADRGWKVDFIAPQLNDWRPWHHALKDVTQQEYGAVSPSILKECARAFVDDILAGLPAEALAMMQPLSNKAAINGIPGVKFIDKMNFKSSMGEPYNKTKKNFLVGGEGDMEFIDEIKERIHYIENHYKEGIRAAPVFSGKLKDEARARAKVMAGKIRVFTGAPADWCFVVRKYLLTTVKVIQEHPFLFEASPGCTVQSLEWEGYYDFLTQFGLDRLIAGDYGKFDKKMEALMILMAFWILAELLKAAGWSEDEVMIIYCIGEDVAYSYVNFNGDLLQFFGSNPSGQPLTVIINCIVNALYMRYAYVQAHPEQHKSVYDRARTFKTNVALLTYGDDNAMGVRRGIDWFNHTVIQEQMRLIGVEYTMADKESESRPFIHIRDVSYLKRTWRWDEDIGAVVCPLEVSSIHKMLTVCLPSDTESKELHMASVMVSAANEWFWYGRETFERERAWLVKLAKEHDLTHELEYKKLPTWDELVERFYNASKGIEVNRLKEGCKREHPRSLLPN